MADDNNQELKIHIVSDADNSGFKSAASAAEDLGGANTKTTEATQDLTKAQEIGSEQAAALHKNHRALHQILHLIARESGPAAGVALAGIGAAAGGGITLAVMAVGELLGLLRDMNAEAEALKAKSRDAFIEVRKGAEDAEDSVLKLRKGIDDFWTSLDRKNALGDVKTAFDQQLQQFRNIADAQVAAGLISKEQGDEFVHRNELRAKMERAAALDISSGSLSDQLNRLKESSSGDAAKKREEELNALKNDQAKLADAFSKNELFRPTSVARNFIGVLMPGTDQANYQTMQDAISREIRAREAQKQSLAEHISRLESEIDRRTGESAGLKADVDKGRIADATKDFGTGKGISDTYLKGGALTNGQQQFLIILEQAITGQKQTLDSAARLMNAQAGNISVATQLIEHAHGRIAAVDERLTRLAAQVNSSSFSRR